MIVIVSENQIKQQLIWKIPPPEIEISCRVETLFCIVSHEYKSLFLLLMSSILENVMKDNFTEFPRGKALAHYIGSPSHSSIMHTIYMHRCEYLQLK